MEKVRLNEKGILIAGSLFLGGIVLAIITLALLWVLWTFWKPLFPFAALVGIGGLILYVTVTIIPKFVRGKQGLNYIIGGLAIGSVIVLAGILPVMFLSIGETDAFDITNAIVSPQQPFSAVSKIGGTYGGRLYVQGNPFDTLPYNGFDIGIGSTVIIPYEEFEQRNEFGKVVLEVANCTGLTVDTPYDFGSCDKTREEFQSWCWSYCGPQVSLANTPTERINYCKNRCWEYVPGYPEVAGSWTSQNQCNIPPLRSVLESFEIWVDDQACELQEGTMVIAETFSAGKTVTKADFRFVPKAYCSQLPILVTSEGNVVEQKLEEYAIIDASFITIPPGQTWTFFYIIDITPEITVICDEGTYNPGTGVCEVTPGIVHVCSVGIFDPEEALCIVQPGARYVCEKGYYDTALGLCVYQVPAGETQIICPGGSQLDVDEFGIQRCFFEPELTPVCEKGNYDAETDTCKYLPDTEVILGFSIQQIILAGIVAIVLIGIAFMAIKGGKK